MRTDTRFRVEKYYKILQEGFEKYKLNGDMWNMSPEDISVWMYLAGDENLFNVVTYDSRLDEILSRKILKALIVIHKQTFYQLPETEQDEHIIALNLKNIESWLEWGISVRGAWLETNVDCGDENPYRDRAALFLAILKLIQHETGEDLLQTYG